MLRISMLLLFAFSGLAVADDRVFSTDEGAIRGYDPVAYHHEGKPVLGSAAFVHTWSGASWRFASAANRDAFAATPERFAPQYGGYCAYGTSQGYKVSTQPEAFAIVDGKLYLNYNKPVQTTWNKDQPGYIRVANDNWRQLEHAGYTSGK
ncbi:MAG: YHS domain-containing (seleno)protein [Pseudomarimonas sp.]